VLVSRETVESGAAVIVLDCAQRSDAWRRARCGKATASRADDVLARGRFGFESTSRRKYLRQLCRETLSGVPEDATFVSSAMRRGRLKESDARAAYAQATGHVVSTSGFILHDELAAGCSLDGYVGDCEGIVEIKVPNTLTHLGYATRNRVPARYVPQIVHQLWITGAQWCDFVSFDDRSPWRPLVIVRVERHQLDIARYERELRRFLDELAAVVTPAQRAIEFFRSVPVDVARDVLVRCKTAVDARRLEVPPSTAPTSLQPRLRECVS
jgi:hypothetical protein